MFLLDTYFLETFVDELTLTTMWALWGGLLEVGNSMYGGGEFPPDFMQWLGKKIQFLWILTTQKEVLQNNAIPLPKFLMVHPLLGLTMPNSHE